MYKVIYCEKENFFGEFEDKKEKVVSKKELIEMLNNAKIFVIEAKYKSN